MAMCTEMACGAQARDGFDSREMQVRVIGEILPLVLSKYGIEDDGLDLPAEAAWCGAVTAAR
jgi:hypothetical protein